MKRLIPHTLLMHWSVLTVQQKRFMVICLWLLMPILVYVLLWVPAHAALPKIHTDLIQLRAEKGYVESLAKEITALQQIQHISTIEDADLLAIIEQSAKQAELPVLATLGGQSTIQLSSDSISFAAWIKWQRTLQSEHQIHVSSVRLNSTSSTGLVSLNATLVRGEVL